MPIRRLDPLTIDRIAAGEVIERPAAAIKELIENALDAGAKSIEVAIEAGGRRLIRVVDDGHGMDEADLALAVERHATSKIPDRDLTAIMTFGFRGEALPSIASVSRLEIRTREPGAPTGLRLVVEDEIKSAIEPCASSFGARVEARELFAATPARLKFLKSDRAEALAVADAVKRLAMAAPQARFSFTTDIGSGFDWPASGAGEAGFTERLRQALGDDFALNSVPLEASRDGARLLGRAGLPTYSRPNASQQFLFVNGRAVRDKTLAGALRGAYIDFLPPDRHAVAALFVECDPAEVDVNVHPAKAEVRFRDAQAIRALIVGALKQRLSEALHRASTTGGSATILAMRPRNPTAERHIPRAGTGGPRPRRRNWPSRRRRVSLKSRPLRRRRLLGRASATSPLPLARRGRRCMRITSSPRRGTGSSSSTSTRRMSASSMSGSSLSARRAGSSGRFC